MSHAVLSFEFYVCLFPNLFIYLYLFALYFVVGFCLCYKYAKAFDTFYLLNIFLLFSATLIIKTYCMQKISIT